MVGNLVSVLEDTVADISVVNAHWLSLNQTEVATDDAYLVVELNKLVAVHGEVEASVPREVAILRRVVTEIELHTMVLHLTCVHEFRCILTSYREHGRNGNHVLGVLPVVIERQTNMIVEKKGIDTEICLGGSLPFQVGVTGCQHLDTAHCSCSCAVEVVSTVAHIVCIC